MSNPLAIATVTAVLESRLRALLDGLGLSSVSVTAGPPTDATTAGIYLSLVQVLPNPQLNNQSMPFRRDDGTAMARPTTSLDLTYLFSFGGDIATWEPERLMGLVLNELNVRPVLTATEIADYAAALTSTDPLFGTDLSESAHRVRFAPLALDLESLSRLWGMYGLSFYLPSVAWRASVVTLDAELDVTPSLPVGGRGLRAVSFAPPVLTGAASAERDWPVVLEGEAMVLSGRNLRGEVTRVRIDGEDLEPDSATASEVRLTVSGLAAGVKLVRIVHYVDLEDGSADPLRPGPVSNTLAVAVAPVITPNPAEAAGTTDDNGDPALEVRLDVSPTLSADQELVLLLNLVGGGGAHRFTGWTLDGAQAVFVIPEIDAGDYLARLIVDGAESLLSTDGDGVYDGPVVTVT